MRSIHEELQLKQESQKQATLANDFFGVTKVDNHVHMVLPGLPNDPHHGCELACEVPRLMVEKVRWKGHRNPCQRLHDID